MKQTIRSIANDLGLSPATVSKALSGRKEISQDTRNRVMSHANEIGYFKRAEGRRRLAILTVSPADQEDSHTSLLLGMMMGFRRYAGRLQYDVVILNADAAEQERETLDRFAYTNQLAGLLVSGLSTTDPYYEQLKTTRTPVVTWDVYIVNPMVGSVGTNSISGGELAVAHLTELGHRRIAFVNGHREAYISQERMAGYLVALHRHGIRFDPDLCFEGNFTAESGARAADYIAETDATAVYFAADLMAVGAVRRFRELGYTLPRDMSIVGFDNLPICMGCMPALTTINQSPAALGEAACAVLHGLTQDVPIRHVKLEPQLVIRESAAAVLR
ncbi:MAG: LacI family transcriptional regulator [Clostridia bacterium]|nr:LacI family transcriptional regulator [Clostridia bacterium]